MSQQKHNRQAREYSQNVLRAWYDYGDVSLHEAARKHAVAIATEELITDETFKIQVRCQTSPEIPPAVFNVKVELVAIVLDPRGDTDK
jgi:type III secretion system FlhB-like substrate exporter